MFRKRLTISGIAPSKAVVAVACLAFAALASGCSSQDPNADEQADPGGSDAAAGETFYWIQGPKGIPVHRLSQYGFLQGCDDLEMKCEVVGPDSGDLPPLVDVVNQVAIRDDIAGVSLWSGGLPLFQQPLQAYADQDLPIVIPHFFVEDGFYPGNVAVVSGDIAEGAANIAKAMCADLEGQTGSVAVTQNSKNATENEYSAVFTETMEAECPNLKVLPPELEGIDPAKAIAVAVAIMQSNPDLVGAVSTTGGGATTWAGAQRQAGKEIVVYGTDYTRENLTLIESGEIRGVLGQPVFEESREAARLLKEMSSGEEVEHWTKLPAPVVTQENLDTYLEVLDEVDVYANNL